MTARVPSGRGKSGELHELLFGLLHGTFAYTGMSVLDPFAVPSADRIDDFAAVRDRLVDRLDRLFSEPTIPTDRNSPGTTPPSGNSHPMFAPVNTGFASTPPAD